jgi:hypothetical protein
LNLVDEVDLDKTLKEAAEAIVDSDRFAVFLREKSVVAIDKFLVSVSIRLSKKLTFILILFIRKSNDLLVFLQTGIFANNVDSS